LHCQSLDGQRKPRLPGLSEALSSVKAPTTILDFDEQYFSLEVPDSGRFIAVLVVGLG